MSKASSWPWGDGSYRYFSSPFSLFSAFSAPQHRVRRYPPRQGTAKPRRAAWLSPDGAGGQGHLLQKDVSVAVGSASSPGPDLLCPRHVGSLAAVASGCRRSPAPQLQGQPWKEPSDTTTRPLKGSWGALRLWNLRSRHPPSPAGAQQPPRRAEGGREKDK